MEPNPHAALARRYVAAVEAGARGEALAAFFDPAVVQTDHPNRPLPAGAVRRGRRLRAAAERGAEAVRDQRYEVRSVIADGPLVALQVSWSATVLVPLGQTPAGATIRAELAMVLRFRDGRIVEQHSYDCFAPL